jgi:drug/metabolite transporter (DMT)-like permease
MTPNTTKGVLLAVTTAFLWGFLAIALKVASTMVDSFTIVWIRFTIAFLALFTFFLFQNRQRLRILIKPPFILVVAAVALGWNYLGFMQGVRYTSPGNAQVIIQLGPVLLALAGIIIYKEKLSRRQIVGFVVASVGFLLFYRQQLITMLGKEADFNTGVLWIVSGAFAWSIYAVFQKKLVQTHDAQTMNMFIYGLPAILFMPAAKFQHLATLTPGWWILLILLGANTLIAYGTLGAAFKYIEANKISIIVAMNPIITFITMAILSEKHVSWIPPENISPQGYLAAILVLTGAILVVKRKRKTD